MAGEPSPRSTACFAEKFATGHRTRSSASATSAAFLIVIDNATSAPGLSTACTYASEIVMDTPPAPKAGLIDAPS